MRGYVEKGRQSDGRRSARKKEQLERFVDEAAGEKVSAIPLPDDGCMPENALEQFQFETLRVSNHTACRFAEKARFFRSLWAGRRCAAASRFTFFKGETLYALPEDPMTLRILCATMAFTAARAGFR